MGKVNCLAARSWSEQLYNFISKKSFNEITFYTKAGIISGAIIVQFYNVGNIYSVELKLVYKENPETIILNLEDVVYISTV